MLYVCESFTCGGCGAPRRAAPRSLNRFKGSTEPVASGLQGDEMKKMTYTITWHHTSAEKIHT